MGTVSAINGRGAVPVINDAKVSSTTDSRHSGGRARFRLIGRSGRLVTLRERPVGMLELARPSPRRAE
jgi:hypothetical protein